MNANESCRNDYSIESRTVVTMRTSATLHSPLLSTRICRAAGNTNRSSRGNSAREFAWPEEKETEMANAMKYGCTVTTTSIHNILRAISAPSRGAGVLVLALGMLSSAQAAELPTAPYLPLKLAQQAADAAMAKCIADGYRVSVAVVARSGGTKVLISGDGAGPHTTGSSTGKAFTAASMGQATGKLSELIRDKPELAGLRDMDSRMVILGGGLPIKIAGSLVGGIGVGGAPGGQLDEACAREGVKSIGGE